MWQQVVPASSSLVPSGRLGMASACYESGGLWFIYGGWTGSANSTSAFLSDLWTFQFNTSHWQLVLQPNDAKEAPPPRKTTQLTAHSNHGSLSRREEKKRVADALLCVGWLVDWLVAVLDAKAAMSDFMLFLYESPKQHTAAQPTSSVGEDSTTRHFGKQTDKSGRCCPLPLLVGWYV